MSEGNWIRTETTIKKNGTYVTTVVDHGGDCNLVKKMTQGLGPELSDELTGPEREDTIHERQS